MRDQDTPQSSTNIRKTEAEGGCGVVGLACEEKIAGKHLLPGLKQMRNRGNGKGGGIAAVGLDPKVFGVTQDILENDYLLAIAYLDTHSRKEIEKNFIHEVFEIDHIYECPHVGDYTSIPGLEIQPPEAFIYFVRVKSTAIEAFREKHYLKVASKELIEDEIVYNNSYRLNETCYAAKGDKKAFVLSHAKNLLVLKMVGYGDDVIRYYKLEDFKAHVWIGHHRYPTKGKVWHPGGAHPFIGLHEALVHNGDFANYSSICEYLAQRNIRPLFLTDTEVSVLLFDLFHRVYKYPLEYVIEALAPTTERDFSLLPEERQFIYQMLQKTHIHGSPDGPWFFLIAQSLSLPEKSYSLIGITDTSMLRPQVFAMQTGPVAIGLAASEKQAIDATLKSIAEDDKRIWQHADYYWNARGGSYTDGGAFIFKVTPESGDKARLVCENKFGQVMYKKELNPPYPQEMTEKPTKELLNWDKIAIATWDYTHLTQYLEDLVRKLGTDQERMQAINAVTHLIDLHYPLDQMRRSSLLDLLHKSLNEIVQTIAKTPSALYTFLSYNGIYPKPASENQTLIIDAIGFPPEGDQSLALVIVQMYKMGFKKFMIVNCCGQRFIANGLGPNSQKFCIDVYGSSGDYLGSGIDGAEVRVHGSGQDQLAQIMRNGTLCVYGDVGQTFMYGAKGGKAFVLGNAAGRPLINAVGDPKVVINGTCLDYLAESFMAGNPLEGGGFVIVNGIKFTGEGKIVDLETPYAGGNLFSLASGGCIYIRDPANQVTESQLNGGKFTKLTHNDWKLILPFLETNERLFNIPIERLLQYKEKTLNFYEVYRKIIPVAMHVMQEEEAWVKGA